MVCGIVALVVWYFGLILGPLGIIFGVIGRKRSREAGAQSLGMGLAGIICGSTAIAIWTFVIIAIVVGCANDPYCP